MTKKNCTAPNLALVGADHVEAYRVSDGKLGYLWNGVPTLLLTVTGRRTGKPRTSALIFARDNGDYLVVASMGGAPTHPKWYLNLQENQAAQIQVRDRHFQVTARTATPQEKSRLWRIVTDVWPSYDVYQSRTDRDLPVVVLTQA